uniref:Uncharacterized protein LOC100376343 n=1 Tax=Saccoglossus kowalevskii TaxID=10224 RepID=A0ABM0H0H5_SACKO|nr:PREDICTED: uncharacterized protein LOC100376343 [Saccoglossus kowalevskii]
MQWMIASLSMQSNTDDAMANNCYPLKPKISETDDQHERLTSRHIETLGFLQEVVRENKRLKATVDELQVTLSSREELFEVTRTSKERIKKFQEECLQKIKKSKEELVKRHNEEIMKLVADKLETENVWLQERKKVMKSPLYGCRLLFHQESRPLFLN